MKLVSPFLALTLLAVAGCSGGTPSATESTGSSGGSRPVATGSTMKIALLTPGPISDAGWSALAYSGLQYVHDQTGAEVNYQQANDAQIRDAMRSYAQKGYKLVIGHGFEYNEPAVEIAKDFPDTVFVSTSGGKTAPNAGAFRFELEQGFFLAGMAAALTSKTGTVAMIGGPDVPSIRSTFKAFRAGAEAAKPGVKVIETFTGQNNDIAAANQATLKAIEQGADCVIHQANAAAQGVFDACKAKGVWAFGANSDQNANASGVVLASAVIKAEPAFLDVAKKVESGQYKGTVDLKTMKDGAVEFVWSPSLSSKVAQDVKDKVAQAEADILSGKLVVPMDQF